MSEPVVDEHKEEALAVVVADASSPATGRELIRHEQSIWDLYQSELRERGPFVVPPPDSDEAVRSEYATADFRRWMALHSAQASGSSERVVRAIDQARTPQQVRAALAPDQSVRSIDDLVRQHGAEAFSDQAGQVHNQLVAAAHERAAQIRAVVAGRGDGGDGDGDDDGAIVLQPGVMAKAFVDELAKRRNVYVLQSDDDDAELARRKRNAEAARAFVETGMVLLEAGGSKDYREGIDEQTPLEVREKFETDVLAAASAMMRYEQYVDPRKRDDGQFGRQVQLDVKAYSDRVAKESNGSLQRLDQCALFDSVRVAAVVAEKALQCKATLLAVEVLDCAFYTSHLATVIMAAPQPRVLPFSALFAIYSAGLYVCIHSDATDSHSQVAKLRRERDARMQAAGLRVHPYARKGRVLLPEYSNKECHAAFLAARANAREVFSAQMLAIVDWAGSATREQLIAEMDLAPEAAPADLVARTLYENVAFAVRDYARDILAAYEMAICLYLHKYIPRADLAYLGLSSELPVASQMHPDMLLQTEACNKEWSSARAALFAASATASGGEATSQRMQRLCQFAFPCVDLSVLDKRAVADDPCSPTYGQLQEFVKFVVQQLQTSQDELAKNLKLLQRQLAANFAAEERTREQRQQEEKTASLKPGLILKPEQPE